MKHAAESVLLKEIWIRCLRIINPKYLLSIILVSACLQVHAQYTQIPIGNWQIHTSFYNIAKLLETPKYVYAANKLSLFRYDKQEHITEQVSKLQGLSDASVGALGYDPILKIVIIGYQSGNIDLLYEDGSVFNINAIVRANITGDKNINEIKTHNSQAYLACGFGLVVINLARKEIKLSNSTLGSNNASIAVNTVAILNDTLYVGTQESLLTVPISANLQNSASYYAYKGSVVPIGSQGAQVPKNVITFNNKVYVYYADLGNATSNGLYTVEGKKITPLAGNELKGDLSYFAANDKELVVTSSSKIVRLNTANERTIVSGMPLIITFCAIPAQSGGLWIGEYNRQLFSYENGAFTEMKAQGSYLDEAIQISSSGNKVLFAGGSYESRYYGGIGNQSGYSILSPDGWHNAPFVYKPGVPYSDCCHILYSERWKKTFASLWGGGLLIVNDDSTSEVLDYKTPGSTLETATPQPTEGYTRISCTAVDNKGLLWMGNFTYFTGKVGLHTYDLNTKKFTAIAPTPPYDQNAASFQSPMDIIVADNNDKWIRIAPNRNNPASVWVVGDNPNNQKIISPTQGQGGLPAVNVNDIAKDQDGAIWLGTEKGLAVFYTPANVLRSSSYNAFLPIFEGRPILENEAVTAIAIDGGGRKWVGTRSKGVFLFNKELNKVISTFTVDNSPLLSNQILDIAINHATGEVFFATDQGIVSYRSDATDGALSNDGIVVFPNPVRPNYDGSLGITGLPDDAEVKITDIAGRKVYEGKANGGAISWGLTDYNGRRAKTGIYLIFSAVEGGDKQIGKFAVVE